ncbi:hypothetical protein [Chamaesiphon sp. VAR_48_metabat_135_sub]|uniref:hypothetical protein n=1 Tax=Chamaesiphon sp. VAR_48_metabat_135_sub TaxID=2964699 RepID=UPI00286A8E57|nr:hypothetical protein [Chamaesiphon sp. VAR_48_metabat_135_sub]
MAKVIYKLPADRSRLKPIDPISKAPSTVAKVIYKLPTDRSRLKPIDLKIESTIYSC